MGVIVIGGATASGKTDLAVALAKKYNGEVISADALLVYKGLDIGTAKPTEEEKGGIVHHLIDVVAPDSEFSVSDYERLARPILEDILSRNKTPVICGGTGFYIKSLLFKSQFGNAPADPVVRQKYNAILEEKGASYLHSLLEEIDAESASVLHENDVKRVIRALEIYETTGKKKSEQTDKEIPLYDYSAYAVEHERAVLYERINRRVDLMFERGLKEEVQSLLACGVDPKAQCMQGIGYKEVIEGIELGWSIEEIKELIKKNTRNYAKRQLTFFRKFPNIKWLKKEDINTI